MNVQKIHQPSTLRSHDSVYFKYNHKGVAQPLAAHFLWWIQKVLSVYWWGTLWSHDLVLLKNSHSILNQEIVNIFFSAYSEELSMFWLRKVLVFWTWNYHVLSIYWLSTGRFVPSDKSRDATHRACRIVFSCPIEPNTGYVVAQWMQLDGTHVEAFWVVSRGGHSRTRCSMLTFCILCWSFTSGEVWRHSSCKVMEGTSKASGHFI